jgi:hypothetical protein
MQLICLFKESFIVRHGFCRPDKALYLRTTFGQIWICPNMAIVANIIDSAEEHISKLQDEIKELKKALMANKDDKR